MYLESDPLPRTRIDLPRRDQAGAYGAQRTTQYQDRRVISPPARCSSSDTGEQDARQEQGQEGDA